MKVVPILSKRGHEPPLPRPFDMPQNFPQTISTGLISHKLTGKPRANSLPSLLSPFIDIRATQLMKNTYMWHRN